VVHVLLQASPSALYRPGQRLPGYFKPDQYGPQSSPLGITPAALAYLAGRSDAALGGALADRVSVAFARCCDV